MFWLAESHKVERERDRQTDRQTDRNRLTEKDNRERERGGGGHRDRETE